MNTILKNSHNICQHKVIKIRSKVNMQADIVTETLTSLFPKRKQMCCIIAYYHIT